MAVAEDEVRRRVALLVEGLRNTGLRLTHQRLEVAREIAASDTHPDVETVYRRVRKRVPTVSIDTVYRTIATLADLGLVDRVSVLTGPARYDSNLAQHHHFVCTRCGLIRDVDAQAVDHLEAPPGACALGTVEYVKVQFRGVCRECSASQEKGH